jgi:hypothetical protein
VLHRPSLRLGQGFDLGPRIAREVNKPSSHGGPAPGPAPRRWRTNGQRVGVRGRP